MLVVPVYNMIVAPDATLFFQTDQLRRNSGDKSVTVNEKIVIIVAKGKWSNAELNEDSFYPIGVAGTVTEINNHGYAVVRTQYRVNVEDVQVNPDHSIKLTISRRRDIEDLSDREEMEKVRGLQDEMRKFASGLNVGDTVNYIIDQVDSVGAAACAMSALLDISNEERYAILEEDSKAKRAEMIEKMLYEFMEVGRITNEANLSQQQE